MSLFTPSKIKHVDHLDRAKFLFIWRLTFAFTILLPILAVTFYLLEPSIAYLTYSVGFIIVLFSLIHLYVKHNFKLIFLLFTILGTIVIQSDLFFVSNSHHYPNFLWMVMLIILAFYGIGKVWGGVVLLVNAAGASCFFILKMYDHYEEILTVDRESAYLLVAEVPIIMAIIGYLVYLNNKAHDEIRNELLLANQDLELNNKEISKRDKEKTILVKEIHHRVKNNLQIIISLLRLQMSDVKSAETRKHFSEAINRVMVMSSIHQKLYRQEEVTEFKMDTYVEELALELKAFFLEEFPIELDIKANNGEIDLKTIVPLGLILNELLSNSFKYAFENKNSGTIRIEIEDGIDDFTMYYSDNGLWKKPKSAMRGFGSELIEILTDQLNGIKTFKSNSEGTFYTFRFKKNQE